MLNLSVFYIQWKSLEGFLVDLLEAQTFQKISLGTEVPKGHQFEKPR